MLYHTGTIYIPLAFVEVYKLLRTGRAGRGRNIYIYMQVVYALQYTRSRTKYMGTGTRLVVGRCLLIPVHAVRCMTPSRAAEVRRE